MSEIDVDYAVVGAGAMGLAFADALIAASPDATVAIIDRYAQPGGHWTLAYPFVRLHQPSVGYGVNSRALGHDAIDHDGWNAGFWELASSGEVCGYFDQVMRQTLLPTGRVRYFPMSEFEAPRSVRSRLHGGVLSISARATLVDATYQNVEVPAMRAPPYEIVDGVACVSPNALVSIADVYAQFTVIGGGKTGIDACLWLLRHGIEPTQIRWVVPRDSWLIDRALTQPGPRFADAITEVWTNMLYAIDAATSLDDLFDRLEACGRFLRLDPAVKPTMYRCATVSKTELDALRRIDDVVRLGRVRRIEPATITLSEGTVAASPDTLYVDCTADGLAKRPDLPVFAPGRITLQSIRTCQQVFSAAMIGHVEAMHDDPAIKNRLCTPIAHPDTDRDFLRTTIADAVNEAAWADDAGVQAWLASSRLNWIRDLGPPLPEDAESLAEALAVRRQVGAMVAAKLTSLLHDTGEPARAA